MRASPAVHLLQIRDFGPVSGTPLIPPSYLTVYFVAFSILLTVLYVYLYRRHRPPVLWRKVRLLLVTAVLLKVTLIGGGTLLAAYWIIPTPNIRRTIPTTHNSSFSPTHQIEIVFDRPVNRKLLKKSISPDIPGRWVFEDSLYTTHLYRRLVFYPSRSFSPNTTYTVTLTDIQNLLHISNPYEYKFDFTTQPVPSVKEVSLQNDEENVSTNAEITVTLAYPNENISDFNFQFDPPIDASTALDSTFTKYSIIPKTPLKQGTKYTLSIQKSDVVWDFEEEKAAERSPMSEIYKTSFTTKEAPGITSLEPHGTNATLNADIVIHFTEKMDRKSVQDNFSITPFVQGTFIWSDDQTFIYKPRNESPDTEYQVTIGKGSRSQSGFFEADVVKTFKTIGPVKVSQTLPQNDTNATNIRTPISFTFDQEVEHDSAQEKFSITPSVEGSFEWQQNKMSFIPRSPLAFSTSYTARISPDVKSIHGQNSRDEFKTTFTTQNTSEKLAVPVYLQKYTLSCEIASLRMALNFRGANVSEDDLIPKVGVDNTPHNGNTWGDPTKAFVGNIAGTQMKNGYGVHWQPIAKAARNYRNATDFSGWTIEQLTHELSAGNPVIIWVYSHFGTKTTWNTPGGVLINAVRDEHAVVAVGYVGPAQNPTQIIINDPLVGQVYWTRSSFDKKWGIFGNSGVVIY